MFPLLVFVTASLVIAGVALMRINDAEGVVEGFGVMLLVFAAIAGAVALAEWIRRRRSGAP
jgi:hypothetical protein